MSNINKQSQKLLSPCVGVCQLHITLDICVGCLRTSKEVALWPSYSEDEQRTVLKSIEKRKKLVL